MIHWKRDLARVSKIQVPLGIAATRRRHRNDLGQSNSAPKELVGHASAAWGSALLGFPLSWNATHRRVVFSLALESIFDLIRDVRKQAVILQNVPPNHRSILVL